MFSSNRIPSENGWTRTGIDNWINNKHIFSKQISGTFFIVNIDDYALREVLVERYEKYIRGQSKKSATKLLIQDGKSPEYVSRRLGLRGLFFIWPPILGHIFGGTIW